MHVCAWVCTCLSAVSMLSCTCVRGNEELRSEGVQTYLIDSCSFVHIKQPLLTLIPPPHCLVQIDLYDPDVCGDLGVCMHSLPPHQSTTASLLITLHSAHLSTCLLVLVISPAPNELKLVTTAYQWKWRKRSRESAEMRWKERWQGDERTRRWGNEEMGEGGVKSHDRFCSASWGLQQHPQPPVQWKGAFLKNTPALFKMKYLTLERKQMITFIGWLWYVSKQRFGGFYFFAQSIKDRIQRRKSAINIGLWMYLNHRSTNCPIIAYQAYT